MPARIQRNIDRLAPKPGIAERAITKRYQEAVRSTGPSQPFAASEAGKAFSPRFREQAAGVVPDQAVIQAAALNRCLHAMNDELPGDLAPPKAVIDHTERDGVPGFLDRRKANGNANDAAEATFVDLVGG